MNGNVSLENIIDANKFSLFDYFLKSAFDAVNAVHSIKNGLDIHE